MLILGCGTETTVVEEPVAEESTPITGEPLLAVHAKANDLGPVPLGWGTVDHGEANVDPEPLNVDGFRFEFFVDLKLYRADLRTKDGESLHWLPQGVVDHENIGNAVVIKPGANSQLLELDTEYMIYMFAQSTDCTMDDRIIPFRTARH